MERWSRRAGSGFRQLRVEWTERVALDECVRGEGVGGQEDLACRKECHPSQQLPRLPRIQGPSDGQKRHLHNRPERNQSPRITEVIAPDGPPIFVASIGFPIAVEIVNQARPEQACQRQCNAGCNEEMKGSGSDGGLMSAQQNSHRDEPEEDEVDAELARVTEAGKARKHLPQSRQKRRFHATRKQEQESGQRGESPLLPPLKPWNQYHHGQEHPPPHETPSQRWIRAQPDFRHVIHKRR